MWVTQHSSLAQIPCCLCHWKQRLIVCPLRISLLVELQVGQKYGARTCGNTRDSLLGCGRVRGDIGSTGTQSRVPTFTICRIGVGLVRGGELG